MLRIKQGEAEMQDSLGISSQQPWPEFQAGDEPLERYSREGCHQTVKVLREHNAPESRESCLELRSLSADHERIRRELEVVRQAAIQAIIEKDEIIEELRQKIYTIQLETEETLTARYEAGIRVQVLEREQGELLRTISRIREEHINECADKDRIICELGQEIDGLKEKMDLLVSSDRSLTVQVEEAERSNFIIEAQLEQLRIELFRAKFSLKEYESTETSTDLGTEKEALNSEAGLEAQEPADTSEEELEVQRERHREQLEQMKCHYERLMLEFGTNCEGDISGKSIGQGSFSDSCEERRDSIESKLYLTDRRRSSITNSLAEEADIVQERVEAATNYLMKSLRSTEVFYQDSGFSRLHFPYVEKVYENTELPTIRVLCNPMKQPQSEGWLDIVKEKSDSNLATTSRTQLEPQESVKQSNHIQKTPCQRFSGRPQWSRNVDSPPEPSFEIGKWAGWGLIAVAGGLFLKQLLRVPLRT